MEHVTVRERTRAAPSRVVKSIAPLPTFDEARARALVEREQALDARVNALEAGEAVVRISRNPDYFEHFVGLFAAKLQKGGEVRLEVLATARTHAEAFILALFEFDRPRYRHVHGIEALSLPAINLVTLGQRFLMRYARESLGFVLDEGFRSREFEDKGQARLSLASEVEEVLKERVGLRVEVELGDDANGRPWIARVRTLRPGTGNIDTMA